MGADAVAASATAWAPVPLVGEVTLLVLAEPVGLWEAVERVRPGRAAVLGVPVGRGTGARPVPAGITRAFVRGKRVLDVASGSGLVAIAAAKAGARR